MRSCIRLARFHLLNGTISLVGNVAITAILAGVMGLDPVVANIVAIVVCSTLNFFGSNALVFRVTGAAAVAIVLAGAPTARALMTSASRN